MSRNDQSHFSSVPNVDIGRSRFERPSRLLTTFNAGKLVPIFVDECLPGDTVTMDVASLVRMSTPIFPTMDNAYLDYYFFFVPNRLLWDHWREMNGENRDTYWTQPTEYNVPMLEGYVKSGSLGDYFGLPVKTDRPIEASALPFRAYTLIWNEFFRDQNYMSPAFFTTGDSNDEFADNSDEWTTWSGLDNACLGGAPLPVAKFHDYFTSVLPAPQKGESVLLPVLKDSTAPVVSMDTAHGLWSAPLHLQGNFSGQGLFGFDGNDVGVTGTSSIINVPSAGVAFDNLFVDLDERSLGTINELRQAFQIQKLLERDARGGTRYTEILNAHFGVTSPDSRLQRPEYLGGKRVPINIDQVLQTSATNDVSPQGNTAAFSLTTDVDSSFTKSFVEHGYLIGVACVRTDHTYQQGVDKMWSRKRRFDFYWPALANISEQPVFVKEILAGIDSSDDVFGYQEAWAEYRYKPSRVCGAFRSNYTGSLDSWHYADHFVPSKDGFDKDIFIADRDFMAETQVNIDRTLAVQSTLEDQFLGNFFFKATWVRPMPMFSVPGFIDHN